MKLTLLGLGLIFSVPAMAQDGHREHGAHQHGHASMNIAISGGELQIELLTPAFNLLGFEHKPSTQQLHQLLDDTVHQLKKPSSLILPDAAAQCEPDHITLHSELLEDEHHEDEDHKDEHHDDEKEASGHSDFELNVHFHCQQPDKLTRIDAAGLFKTFPSMEELKVQWISENKQSSVELSPRITRVILQ